MTEYMKKMFVPKNDMLFHCTKRLIVFCLFFSIAIIATAEGTYYSRLTVHVQANSNGKGKVWASANKDDKPVATNYKADFSAEHNAYSASEDPDHTYYVWALPTDGFYHVGWNMQNIPTSENNSNVEPYKVTCKDVKSKDTGSPTEYNYYAIFAPVTVSDVAAAGSISSQDYQGKATCEVTFNVENADSPDDFNASASGEGFDVLGATYVSNQVTLTIQYTDQNVHGTNIATSEVKLQSKGNLQNVVSTTIQASSDLTPKFTKPADYSFGEIYTGDTKASGTSLYATSKNNAASQPKPATINATGAIWTATITGADASAFVLTDEYPALGECIVTFCPTEARTYTATLNLTVRYTDSNGYTINSSTTTTALTGSAKVPETSAIVFSPTTVDMGSVLTGDSVDRQVTVSQQNVTGVTYSFGDTNAANVFSFASAAGSVTLLATPTAPGTYRATLTATGQDTRAGQAGTTTTGSLPISITVGLQSPILVGGSNLTDTHYLKWSKVPCATSYEVYEVSGGSKTLVDATEVANDETHITSSIASTAEQKTYMVKAISNYGGVNYVSWSNEVNVQLNAIGAASTPYLDIWTGTERNSTTYPYHPKAKVDLSATFDVNGKALFDQLYIFGLTTPSNGGTELYAVRYGQNQYTTPNAVTPCYIYDKAPDGRGYTWSKTIDNMNPNAAQKPIPTISATGQKLYFTGHCPYGSNGSGAGQVGVICIEGGKGAKVDVYLQNLFLHARFHSQVGSQALTANDTIVVDLAVNGISYIPASASAFVFSSTSEDENQPFSPTIHLRDSNKLDGGMGYTHAQAMGLMHARAGCYAAPIHMYVQSGKHATTLSIDDKWPTTAEENINGDFIETERTNGILNVCPKDVARPSIELGNPYSTLNFNGGQIYLKNNLPVAQSEYICTFAISYRSFSKAIDAGALGRYGATLCGMGEDQPEGNVHFNDGSFYSESISNVDWKSLTCHNYYHNQNSLKCPVNTTINGGTYYCDIWSCFGTGNKGGSPSNKYNNPLVRADFPITNVPSEPHYLATIDFDAIARSKVCEDSKYAEHADYGRTMAQYYMGKTPYGCSSLKANESGMVSLMIPSQFTDKVFVEEVKNIAWAVCFPTLGAEGAGIQAQFGGPVKVASSSNERTRFLLYAEGDQHALTVAGPDADSVYVAPDIEYLKDSKVQIQNSELRNDVTNTSSYQVDEAQYVIKPIEAADRWMLFSPPFDVTKIYVLEAYPEEKLVEMAQADNSQAYYQQAKSTLEFLFYLGYYTVCNSTAAAQFWAIHGYWKNDTNLEKGRGAVELFHFTGSNYDANYYLQRSSGTWDWDGTKFTTDWRYLPATPEKVTHGDKQYDVVMRKGEIYSMNFPYMYNGFMDDGGAWDYWTGKYLIFEGLGPQTIEGKDYHNTIQQSMVVGAGKAELRGNSTFAALEVTDNDAYYLPDGGQKFVQSLGDPVEITPMGGFLLANPPAGMLMPGRKAAIDMMSGTVTYEDKEDEDFSTPTIAGEHTLLVYTTPDGLGIMPVVPQQVAIYNAAGQLVTSQYVAENTQFVLPAGIYLIKGENEQVKAMVK